MMSQTGFKKMGSFERHVCFACLCNSEDYKLQDYVIKHTQFWQIFEVERIKLCYICRRIAQQAELFIQNVQNNQILLQTCVGDFSTVKDALTRLKNPINLTHVALDPIHIVGENAKYGRKSGTGRVKKVKVAKKVKMEEEVPINVVKTEAPDDDYDDSGADVKDECGENGDPTTSIKQEDDLPLTVLLMEKKRTQNIVEKTEEGTVGKKLKRSKTDRSNNRVLYLDGRDMVKRKLPSKHATELQNKMYCIEKVKITQEEVQEERRQHSLELRYANCTYKCENCVQGFNFKDAYDKHMRRHTDEYGIHECSYCKIRMPTPRQMFIHTKSHLIRFKCTLCGLFRSSRVVMLDHHNIAHKNGEIQLPCPHCDRTFNRHFTRKMHIKAKHLAKERLVCSLCPKTYATKVGLKSHIMAAHPTESACEIKQYKCDQCGLVCRTTALLRNHQLIHTSTRDYYCVECDKAYKTKAGLKQHLKTTQIHVDKAELKLACPRCDKRFMLQRDLDGHINAVHLDIRPYKCDQCYKTYTCKSALRSHQRLHHEGHKLPLKYCCEYCDKRFSSGGTLKNHIRTHTGERPFQCDMCPANFNQKHILVTHTRLIHQQLTRSGRPKYTQI